MDPRKLRLLLGSDEKYYDNTVNHVPESSSVSQENAYDNTRQLKTKHNSSYLAHIPPVLYSNPPALNIGIRLPESASALPVPPVLPSNAPALNIGTSLPESTPALPIPPVLPSNAPPLNIGTRLPESTCALPIPPVLPSNAPALNIGTRLPQSTPALTIPPVLHSNAPLLNIGTRLPKSTSAAAAASDSPQRPRRTRVSRACDMCNERKAKCDEKRPTCGACHKVGARCTFERRYIPRGPPNRHVQAQRQRDAEHKAALEKRKNSSETSEDEPNLIHENLPLSKKPNVARSSRSSSTSSDNDDESPIMSIQVAQFFTRGYFRDVYPILPTPHEALFARMFDNVLEIRVTNEATSVPVALVASLIAYYASAYPEAVRAYLRSSPLGRKYLNVKPLIEASCTLVDACRGMDYYQGFYTFEDITVQYLLAMTAVNLNEYYQAHIHLLLAWNIIKALKVDDAVDDEHFESDMPKRILLLLFVGLDTLSFLDSNPSQASMLPPDCILSPIGITQDQQASYTMAEDAALNLRASLANFLLEFNRFSIPTKNWTLSTPPDRHLLCQEALKLLRDQDFTNFNHLTVYDPDEMSIPTAESMAQTIRHYSGGNEKVSKYQHSLQIFTVAADQLLVSSTIVNKISDFLAQGAHAPVTDMVSNLRAEVEDAREQIIKRVIHLMSDVGYADMFRCVDIISLKKVSHALEAMSKVPRARKTPFERQAHPCVKTWSAVTDLILINRCCYDVDPTEDEKSNLSESIRDAVLETVELDQSLEAATLASSS